MTGVDDAPRELGRPIRKVPSLFACGGGLETRYRSPWSRDQPSTGHVEFVRLHVGLVILHHNSIFCASVRVSE
jgi:hypothetical protein